MNTIGKRIEPNDEPNEPREPASTDAPSAPDAVLGSLSSGEAAETGGVSPRTKDIPSHKKADDHTHAAQADLEAEHLMLPPGAIVTMRKSGGLRFTSNTVTVHRDGRVAHSSTAAQARSPQSMSRGRRKGATARLTGKQLTNLKMAIAKAGLATPATRTVGGNRQPPDAYAYEVVARAGRKQITLEVFDGSIPEPIKPLIRQLNALMTNP